MSGQASSISFDRNFAPPYGVAESVSPLIARLVCRNPGPFTFRGTATYLIGGAALVIVDPGPDDDAHFQALRTAIAGRPVSHILITHTHLDHSPLATRLAAETGAATVAFGPHGSGRGRADAALESGADLDFSPDLRISDGDELAAAGVSLRAVFTPGHTSNHTAYAVEDEKALLCGDHVMAWSTSVISPPDGHMGDYLASLRKLLGRDDEVYWPTHGPPVRAPHGMVRALIAHRMMRRTAILEHLKEGPQSAATLVGRIYPGLDPPLVAAARQSALAHLEHLIEERRVRNEGPLYFLA